MWSDGVHDQSVASEQFNTFSLCAAESQDNRDCNCNLKSTACLAVFVAATFACMSSGQSLRAPIEKISFLQLSIMSCLTQNPIFNTMCQSKDGDKNIAAMEIKDASSRYKIKGDVPYTFMTFQRQSKCMWRLVRERLDV